MGGLTMDNADAQELRKFGYAQQLRRSLGAFSSFAVAFSLISVFTSVFANFGHGLRQVGGAVVVGDRFRYGPPPSSMRLVSQN